MNITLTITGGSAAEIQQAVQELSGTFAIDAKGQLEIKSVKGSKKSEPTAPIVGAPKADLPQADASTVNSSVTLEQVRAAVQAKAQAGKRTEVKTLLTEFGAENVTSLEKEKYADFLTKVNAL